MVEIAFDRERQLPPLDGDSQVRLLAHGGDELLRYRAGLRRQPAQKVVDLITSHIATVGRGTDAVPLATCKLPQKALRTAG